MAKLIRELKKQFPKARIFGHRDLPGVQKGCPCYDVRADQNAGKPLQGMHRHEPKSRQTIAGSGKRHPDSRQTIAGYALPSPGFTTDRCRVCNDAN